jgi:hypothetical protein
MNDPGSFDPKAKVPEQTGENSAEGSASDSNQRYSGQPDDLHDLFAVHSLHEGDEEDPLAALRNDPNYSALIRDLEYIAKQARLLFEPAAQEAPSDEVWDKIQRELGSRPPEA